MGAFVATVALLNGKFGGVGSFVTHQRSTDLPSAATAGEAFSGRNNRKDSLRLRHSTATRLIVLTFGYLLLLVDEVLDNLFLPDSFLLLVGLFHRLRLRWLALFEHRHVLSETVEIPFDWLAIALLERLCIVKWRSI